MGALLLVMGAGCLFGQREVAGDWYLAFDLPSEWVMVDDYNDPGSKAVELDYEVDRTDSEVVLQNIDKPIVFSNGVTPEESVPADSYVMTSGTRITVTHLDSRRVIPSDAEDLGDGFFQVKLCDEGGECQIGGAHNYEYYFVQDDAKFKFQVSTHAENKQTAIAEVESIIRSAKLVTQNEMQE